ncbi:unnamed protein product [Oikopleura dioica]|uniref:Cyclin-H n=2 Tax=Oikopleura dioica TaxID=34765 RepID=E4YQX1_OIKDI|nr:unnamed protein product [Oikopleura dioica]
MFHTSTQREHWTFSSKDDLFTLRERVNENYRSKMSSRLKLGPSQWLAPDEELKYIKYYEGRLQSFCNHFKVPVKNIFCLPPTVKATSIIYFKRFYLRTSAMEYNPRFVAFACLWLATKVEEFNVSITEFVENLRPKDQEELTLFEDLILSLELPIIHALKYHLTIHNPYRPLEGFLIDLRTRCEGLQNSDILRQNAYAFLEKVFRTDVPLLYPPSVIAIAACRQSASENKLSIDQYILGKLFPESKESPEFEHFKSSIKKIRSTAKKSDKEVPPPEVVGQLKAKWERCRNPDLTDEKLVQYIDDDEDAAPVVETISMDDLVDF